MPAFYKGQHVLRYYGKPGMRGQSDMAVIIGLDLRDGTAHIEYEDGTAEWVSLYHLIPDGE